MFKRLLAFVALLAAPLYSQTAAPSPNLAGIAHVALRVANLDASIAFYQKLGFVKAFDLSRDGKVYEAFIKINDRQFIELYPTDAKNPQVGFLHVCFEGNDLQSVHDYYVSEGLKPTAVKTAAAGNLLFTMPGPMTPQGPQNMEYTQYMPGSLHSKDFGQHLGPDRSATRMVMVGIAAAEPVAASTFYSDKIHTTIVGIAGNPSYLLPGSGTDAIAIVPATALGLKASFVLATPAESSSIKPHLAKLGLVSTPDQIIHDPDGNQVQILHYPDRLLQ